MAFKLFNIIFNTQDFVNIFINQRRVSLKILYAYITQFLTAFTAYPNYLTHNLMGLPERYSLPNQVFCQSRSIQKSFLTATLHIVELKRSLVYQLFKDRQTLLDRIGRIEYRLFIFLHISVVGERQALHYCKK